MRALLGRDRAFMCSGKARKWLAGGVWILGVRELEGWGSSGKGLVGANSSPGMTC
jgi:hypothetical protein